MFQIMQQGLFTTVQDPARRNGYQGQGFPPSGAMDDLALRIGNVLVGNDPDEAGLEYAFSGPSLKMQDEALIAVTGAPVNVFTDDEQVPMWTAHRIKKGQTLSLKPSANVGQWGYISISGGIDVPKYLGSKSTFAFAGVGGFEGRMLKGGDVLKTGSGSLKNEGKRLKDEYIPEITSPMTVELMDGYYMDYLSDEDRDMLFNTEWIVQPDSNRMGYRLSGGKFNFSEKAKNKDKECGAHPSNIFDTGYPLYSLNICGDTPVISTPEAMPCGGYFCPFAIPQAAWWKVGQCRIGSKIRFRYITMDEADSMRRDYRQRLEVSAYQGGRKKNGIKNFFAGLFTKQSKN